MKATNEMRTITNPMRGNDVDAAYQSILMQNHRLRVQLMLERKGISTLNMDLKALQYINDGFKVGFTPDKLAEHMETLMPIWESQSETRAV